MQNESIRSVNFHTNTVKTITSWGHRSPLDVAWWNGILYVAEDGIVQRFYLIDVSEYWPENHWSLTESCRNIVTELLFINKYLSSPLALTSQTSPFALPHELIDIVIKCIISLME